MNRDEKRLERAHSVIGKDIEWISGYVSILAGEEGIGAVADLVYCLAYDSAKYADLKARDARLETVRRFDKMYEQWRHEMMLGKNPNLENSLFKEIRKLEWENRPEKTDTNTNVVVKPRDKGDDL